MLKYIVIILILVALISMILLSVLPEKNRE